MTIQSNVTKALNAASTYGDAIAALRVDLDGVERAEVRATLLPLIAKHYKVEVVEGKLSVESEKYEAAKTVVRDVMHMMAGTTRRAASAKKETEAKVVIIGCDTIAEARAAFEAALAKKFAK